MEYNSVSNFSSINLSQIEAKIVFQMQCEVYLLASKTNKGCVTLWSPCQSQ
jgi:hypothetical protein